MSIGDSRLPPPDSRLPSGRIYLDNAATSWPKPEVVYRAMDDFQRRIGAAAGRGAYGEAIESGRLVDKARQAACRLIAARDARQVVFTSNGTDSLNLVIHGWLRPGDHVITTAAEHNSILRPLKTLERQGRVEVTRVACNSAGEIDPAVIRAALRPRTALIAMTHASNVTGGVLPIDEIGAIARAHGAALLVDAAQSIGHLPIDVEAEQIDFLAAPAHKGLLGPLGTGLLYIRPGLESRLESLRQGGTGTRSEDDSQPNEMPHKFEAGNLNVAALAGLAAGIAYLEQAGVAAVHARERELRERLIAGLEQIAGVTLLGPGRGAPCVGVVSLLVAGYDPQEVAGMLDSSFKIQVRSGLHCAPLMHRSLGTLDGGGTVRLSLGPFNTSEHIDAVIAALADIAASVVGSEPMKAAPP